MTRAVDLIKDDTEVVGTPTVGIGLTYSLGNGRTLTLQTMAPRDADPKVLNGILDTYVTAMERQVAKMVVPAIEDDIRKGTGILEAAEFDYQQFIERNANRALNEQLKSQRANMERQIKLHRDNLDHAREQLEKAKVEAE